MKSPIRPDKLLEMRDGQILRRASSSFTARIERVYARQDAKHSESGMLFNKPPLVAMRMASPAWAALGPVERLALGHLLDMQSAEAGGSYASQATLARWCGCSTRTVQRALQRLVARGLVVNKGHLPLEHELVMRGRAVPMVNVYQVEKPT
jgi:CRP-like cAMP-binding protein